MTALMRNVDPSKRIFLAAFLFSILFHILFFAAFPTTFFPQPTVGEETPRKMIRVARVKPDTGQLVDIQDQKNVTDENVDTDYLSDKNRKVAVQTRSLNITRDQNQSTNTDVKDQPIEKKSKYNLQLSQKAIQDIALESKTPLIFQSMSSNYLPDIAIGTETLLNTKEFAFNSFYIRMKRDIEGFWKPSETGAGNDPNLRGTYVTMVNVVLDETGDLALPVRVVKSSTVDDLDIIAVQAVERASPFPNPPPELLGEDHQIRMNWNFIFDKK